MKSLFDDLLPAKTFPPPDFSNARITVFWKLIMPMKNTLCLKSGCRKSRSTMGLMMEMEPELALEQMDINALVP